MTYNPRFTFTTSVNLKGNDGIVLVPDFECKVEVSRYNSHDTWIVDRVWTLDDRELGGGGDSHTETGIYHDICNIIEADQPAIDERYAGEFREAAE